MPNLTDYLIWRGDLTFDKAPLCDIDALVLSMISYLDYDGEAGTLRSLTQAQLPLPHPNLQFFRDCQDILCSAGRTARFSDVRLHDFLAVRDADRSMQFAAVTADLPDSTHVIAYRGTDNSFTGWKEDLSMAFESPVPAQAAAVRYLENRAMLLAGDFILCGHSKGGNLAVYAAAHAGEDIQRRIRRIISFDGPGMDDATAASPGYRAMEPRMVSYVPRFAVVGLLLATQPEHRVVQSDGVALMQHDAFTWQISGADFLYAEDIAPASLLVNETVHEWLAECTHEQRRVFVETLFDLLTSTRVTNFKDLLQDLPVHLGAMGKAAGQISLQTGLMIATLLGKLALIGTGNLIDMFRRRNDETSPARIKGGEPHVE